MYKLSIRADAIRTDGSQNGLLSPSLPARAKKNRLSFIGTCFSLFEGSNPLAFCLSFITMMVLLGALTGPAFEVDAFDEVAAVLGKFLCNRANAASFFFCLSASSGVRGAASGLVDRSVHRR